MIKIALANQKGGVGKTTSVINIGIALAIKNKKVLLVDLDSQHHLSNWLEYKPDGKPVAGDLIYSAVAGLSINYADYIRHNSNNNIDYIPSTKLLAGLLSIIASDNDSSNVISHIFNAEYFNNYDFILFDCQPSLDLLVTNILKACDKLLIPVQADILSYNGVEDMIDTFTRVKNDTDIKKYLLGMLVTMYQSNTKHSATVYEALKSSYGDLVFDIYISFRTEAKNASAFHASSVSDKNSVVGKQYIAVADKILEVCSNG